MALTPAKSEDKAVKRTEDFQLQERLTLFRNYSGQDTRIVVPTPVEDETEKEPPKISARSLILIQPLFNKSSIFKFSLYQKENRCRKYLFF